MPCRYFERRLAFDEMIQRRLKKRKKNDAEIDVDMIADKFAPKPKYYDVLPVVLVRGTYNFAIWLPKYIRHSRYTEERNENLTRARKFVASGRRLADGVGYRLSRLKHPVAG